MIIPEIPEYYFVSNGILALIFKKCKGHNLHKVVKDQNCAQENEYNDSHQEIIRSKKKEILKS